MPKCKKCKKCHECSRRHICHLPREKSIAEELNWCQHCQDTKYKQHGLMVMISMMVIIPIIIIIMNILTMVLCIGKFWIQDYMFGQSHLTHLVDNIFAPEVTQEAQKGLQHLGSFGTSAPSWPLKAWSKMSRVKTRPKFTHPTSQHIDLPAEWPEKNAEQEDEHWYSSEIALPQWEAEQVVFEIPSLSVCSLPSIVKEYVYYVYRERDRESSFQHS